LAYAFHNLPLEMYGWGTWSVAVTRGRLVHYQDEYPTCGPDYVAMFDAIFPDAWSRAVEVPSHREQRNR
jgi:hypothetical protein